MGNKEKTIRNLVFGYGIHSNIVRFGTAGFNFAGQKKLWIEVIGTHIGSAARTITPIEIIELRGYLDKIIEYNNSKIIKNVLK